MKDKTDWAYYFLLTQAELYMEDAKKSKAMGWTDCAKTKLQHAQLCIHLAEEIRRRVK